MKRMLISASFTVIMLGMSYARQVIISPVVSHNEVGVAQVSLAPGGQALCTTRYIANIGSEGKRSTHKSVDCEE
jgi:hypothetical protein